MVLGHRFVDATTFDEKTGKPKISFEKISDVVPLSKPRRSREFAATRAARLAKLHASLDQEPPMKKPGLYLLYGALRRNEENPDQPLEQCCGFSAFAAACLRHANIPYSTILGDMHHKPKWFEKRWFAALPDSKSATYPAVIRVLEDGSSEFIGDSANVVDAACKWFPDAAATLADVVARCAAEGAAPPDPLRRAPTVRVMRDRFAGEDLGRTLGDLGYGGGAAVRSCMRGELGAA
mgnify:CR=1 FL=1